MRSNLTSFESGAPLEALKFKWRLVRHIGKLEIVETHIRLLKNQDELVEHCVTAKVRRQTFDTYSPLQRWFGTQCAREVEEQGLGENRSSFERRLHFQTAAQRASVRADSRKTLRVVQYAR